MKRELRDGHTGIAREFVHQPLQHVHLVDDRLRALLKDRAFLAQRLAVFLLQPLRRQLDRRQGILDVVRHPARHFAPHGRALGHLQLRQVLEDDHHAHVVPFFVLQDRNRREQGERPVFEHQLQLPFRVAFAALLHLLEDLADELIVLRDQDLFIPPVENLLGADGEQPLGGLVDGDDDAVPVDGDDPGGDVAKNRLHVLPALLQIDVGLLQFRFAPFEILHHRVEGIDEHADLVIGHDFDTLIQVALRDLLRGFGEILDGAGDPLGEEKAEPGRRKDDEQGHDEEGDDEAHLHRILEQVELPILLRRAGNHLDIVHVRLRDVIADEDGADDGLGRHDRIDRGHAADQIAGLHLLHRRNLLADEKIFEHLRRQVDVKVLRNVGIAGEHLLPAVVDVDLERSQMMALPALFDERLEIIPFFLLIEAVARDLGADLPGKILGARPRLLIVLLGELQGLVQGLPDADAEPVVDAVGQEIDRYEEQQHRGNQRQADKCDDELRAEFGADDAAPALEDELDHVADDEKNEEDDQNDVDVDHPEDQDVAGQGQGPVPLEEVAFQQGQDDDDQHRQEDDDPLPLPSPGFLGADFGLPAFLLPENFHSRLHPQAGGMAAPSFSGRPGAGRKRSAGPGRRVTAQ
ncbi:MAG: hypothetical protein A4E73_01222 [Syntrophaceae bacterium PtaU1.Bin231]|nr:MAG: hypothetical protein A4E73_01222 [Syntrophaceae bacterium PtaU1.Bin231]